MLKRIFTWWNGATLGALFDINRRGIFVGEDEQGNRYYEERRPSIEGRRRRLIRVLRRNPFPPIHDYLRAITRVRVTASVRPRPMGPTRTSASTAPKSRPRTCDISRRPNANSGRN